MIVTLENSVFTAKINTLGAELISLTRKSDKTEYIWDGNPDVWKNHAPILFPFVARCLGNYFIIENERREFTKNHGFARDEETNIVLNEKERAVFELTDNEHTINRFPYHFSLKTSYELTDSGLNWLITVKNTDSKPFKFSVGTHTAFNCPRNTDKDGTQNSDYQIEFEGYKKLTSVVCTEDGYLEVEKDKNCLLKKPYNEKESGIIPLTKDGFGNGHLFTDFTSEWVGLRNKKDGSLVKIRTKGFPYCMIWQNTTKEPRFVCIEPWHGIPDAKNTNHEWNEKPGLIELLPGKTFESRQDIIIE